MSLSTVQLRHTLPDGSHHIDWLLDIEGDCQSALTTFRLPREIHRMAPGDEMSALRIADHRRLYLEYEGPLSDDRGTVQRIASGHMMNLVREPGRWRVELRWTFAAGESDFSPIHQQLLLRFQGGWREIMRQWTVFCLPLRPESP